MVARHDASRGVSVYEAGLVNELGSNTGLAPTIGATHRTAVPLR